MQTGLQSCYGTGCAIRTQELRPEVVIVEEAAEVLEAAGSVDAKEIFEASLECASDCPSRAERLKLARAAGKHFASTRIPASASGYQSVEGVLRYTCVRKRRMDRACSLLLEWMYKGANAFVLVHRVGFYGGKEPMHRDSNPTKH